MAPASARKPLAVAFALAALTAPLDEGRSAPVLGQAPVARPAQNPGPPTDEPPNGLSSSDWSQIRRAVRQSEYHAAPVRAGQATSFMAANRAQGYRTTFRPEGVEIVTQTRTGMSSSLAISVTGFGYQGDVRPLPTAEPSAAQERVEYLRGPVTEWYTNRPNGLEQGFTIAETVAQRREPIVLAMSIEGDLQVRLDDLDAASFVDGAGQKRMRYTGLAAWDADGQTLDAHLEASGKNLLVVVASEEARFPVTVDPIFVQEGQLEGHGDPIGSAGAAAGYSVSVDGDTAVVGAPYADSHTGMAYVFVRTGTQWSQQQRLVASDRTFDDFFGYSVSVSQDTAVVARLPDLAGGDPWEEGAAYVFVRSGAVWTEQQKLTISGPGNPYYFGYSASVSGETTIVGTSGDGAAYVFVRSGTVWTQQQRLTASDGVQLDNFGIAVSLSGDTAVIGAPLDDTAGGVDAGSAYVFIRLGTTWSEEQKLSAPDAEASDTFGATVSVSADTAVIGSPLDDGATGSAYVFVRSGTTWNHQQKLTASDGESGDNFGTSVSVAGDLAVIGAPLDDTANGVDAGSAYAFVRSGTTWSQQQQLLAADGAGDDQFGLAVSISGDTAVIGAPYQDTAGGSYAGSAHVFVHSGTAWSEQQKLVGLDGDLDAFGSSTSVSGDTAIVGAPYDSTVAQNSGSAYVFVRSGMTWSKQQKLVASDGAPLDLFGTVTVSGDTAVVGAPRVNAAAGEDVGAAYVFVRTGTTWSQQQKLAIPNGAERDSFGRSVSLSDDDVVIGAPGDWFSGAPTAGSAYVFVRTGGAWSQQQKIVPSDGVAGNGFGWSVSVSGDTLVVGAPNVGTLNTGSAYVFVRSGTVWSEQQKLVASDGSINEQFGSSVALFGDTAVIGKAYTWPDPGSAYVFARSGPVWSEQQKLMASDGTTSDSFGATASVSGGTVVVGAPGTFSGAAYVFVRSGTAWEEKQKLFDATPMGGEAFGSSVSLVGDTVLVGSPGDDTAVGNAAGSVSVFRSPPDSDLWVAKTDGQGFAVPGEPITYSIVASNAGLATVTGAIVTDAVPPALTGATWTCVASFGSSCTASGSGSINDSVSLLVGGAATYSLTAMIDPAATGTLVNTASIAPPPGGNDPTPVNNSMTDTDPLIPEVDLGLLQSDAPDPATAGGTITYTLQIANAGPSASSGMTLTDALPAQVTFISSTPGPPTCVVSSSTVGCNLPGQAPGASQTVTIQVAVNPGVLGTITNTAIVAGNEMDPVAGNDVDTEPTLVLPKAEGELVHGSVLWADLASAGGLPDEDFFRIAQRPYSSYEVLVDGTSGDIGIGQGPQLDRLASDGTTLLQSAVAAGAGASRSLRWQNDTASAANEYLRMRSAGCTTTCGPEDVYRIRSFDTTTMVPRFNNGGTQITVLVLQNTTDAPVTGDAHFWNTAGALLASQAFTMGPKGVFVVNTSGVSGLAGQSGTITLSHDAPYGALTGKAVAVEPTTGFAFDTGLEPRTH